MPDNHKILLVDDHPLVREWLANLINQEPSMTVCGQAGSAREALQLVIALRPAIAVVDLSLEDGSGLELIKDIKAAEPDVAILVLSMHEETLYAERVMRAGARGYIMKREATGKVLEAIHSILSGKTYFSHAVSARLARRLAGGGVTSAASPVGDLSDRELEVFERLGRGCNTKEIADQLNLSSKTVQVYCARIKEKLDLANINELITQAVRWRAGREAK